MHDNLQHVRVLALPAFRNERANPYNALLARALLTRGVDVVEWTNLRALTERWDVVHVHWPEANLNKARTAAALGRTLQLLALLAFARSRGAVLVWTAHNLAAHERRHLGAERVFWRAFLPMVDAWISLTEPAAAAARLRFPRLASRPSAIVAHGHYRDAYPPAPDAVTARRALGLDPDAPTIVFAGRVKRYKQVPALLRAVRDVHERVQVLVAGLAADPAVRAEVEDAARGDDRVVLRLEEITPESMPNVLGAADVVAAPYEDVLNSGSALLALTFARPVLVPAVGSMEELRRAAGDEWVRTYTGPLTGEVLTDALAWARATTRPVAPAVLRDLDWDPLAAQTAALYERARTSR